MIAALHGSLDVLSYLLQAGADPNMRSEDEERCTAMHCAASGGSAMSIDAIKLLLLFGANRSATDAYGRQPVDVLPAMTQVNGGGSGSGSGSGSSDTSPPDSHRAANGNGGGSMLLGGSQDSNDGQNSESSAESGGHMQQGGGASSRGHGGDGPGTSGNGNQQQEPDEETRLSDEFRMYEFKVRRCSRTRAHDWTECPFTHPGEKARRRDPRRFSYSGTACPEFRKGSCPRSDACEFAHGVFECWLHPSRYRTQLCKDGLQCTRRACFFAHASNQLRPPTDAFGNVLSGVQRSGSPPGGMTGGSGGEKNVVCMPVTSGGANSSVGTSNGNGWGSSPRNTNEGSSGMKGAWLSNGADGLGDVVGTKGEPGLRRHSFSSERANPGINQSNGTTTNNNAIMAALLGGHPGSGGNIPAIGAQAAYLSATLNTLQPNGQRRSLDSSFDSMSLLNGMKKVQVGMGLGGGIAEGTAVGFTGVGFGNLNGLGVQHSLLGPQQQQQAEAMAIHANYRGMPRHSTGSDFWMSGSNAVNGNTIGMQQQQPRLSIGNGVELMGAAGGAQNGALYPMQQHGGGVNAFLQQQQQQRFMSTASPPPVAPLTSVPMMSGRGNGGGFFDAASSASLQQQQQFGSLSPGQTINGGVMGASRFHVKGGKVAAGQKSGGNGGHPGMGARQSSFQHLGMIEGVLGDEFYGA